MKFPDIELSIFDRLEASISAKLWLWVTLDPAAQAEITSPQSGLATDLEFFLTWAFKEIEFTRSRKIWCDGVGWISIFQLNPVAFRVVASAFCPGAGPGPYEPVELEFHYSEVGTLKPLRIIFRFGFADRDRAGCKPSRSQQHKGFDGGAILANLPQNNQQWAVAVELTSI